MIQQTTALRKIASLKKPIRVIQGGQGASKTFSILMLLINHASNKENREILILSAELTKMRLTVIKDFVKIMTMFGIYQPTRFISGTLYRFPNGSFIKFIGLDKSDVGKGLRSDVAYFNEVNKIDSETYRQVATRAGQVFCDYNPDASFFIHDEVLNRPDVDYLELTFKDNELLSERERGEILRYKELGYDAQGNIISKYWANKWRVYGLGLVGAIDGAVFENWSVIDSIPKDARLMFGGIDFGFSVSKFAALNVYYLDGKYILDELVYSTKLTNQDAAAELHKIGYNNQIMYCDHAEPKSIEELKRGKIRAVPCDNKQDIKVFAIQKLNSKEFYVTKRSTNLVIELGAMVYDEKTNKPKKSDRDHLIDALLYAIGSHGKYSGNYVSATV
jgi:phage terminase large subunit